MIFNARGTANAQLLLSVNSGVLQYDASNGSAAHAFLTNASEQMRLTSTGLGIGTSSPLAKLHVLGATNGNLLVRGGASAASGLTGTALSSINDAASATVALTFEGSDFNFVENNAVVAKLDSSGNLGIGTSSPGEKLAVAGNVTADIYKLRSNQSAPSSTDAFIYRPADNTIGFGTASAEKMRLDSSGNLGLGVTPSAWLGAGYIDFPGNGFTGNATAFSSNSFYSGLNASYSSGQWRYKASSLAATTFGQVNGAFQWNIAASGTAGNAITFTQAMTLDASGNLLVGTTNSFSARRFRIYGSQSSAASTSLQLVNSSTGDGVSDGLTLEMDGVNGYLYNYETGPLILGTSNTERARIDSSGNLLVGKTSVGTAVGIQLISDGSSRNVMADATNSSSTLEAYSTGAAAFRFYVGMAGTVYATNTTISAISDQRLKENVRDLDDGLSAIMALKPRKFDWKAGKGKDIKDDRGFIAQEFERVFPEMIDNWKDPAPEGEEPYKSVRADLIPVLVKALQELKAEFDAYKATHP